MKASIELELAKTNESGEGAAMAAGRPLRKIKRTFGSPRSTGHVARSLGVALLIASGCGTNGGDSANNNAASDDIGAQGGAPASSETEAATNGESTLAAPVQAAPPPPNENVAPALLLG